MIPASLMAQTHAEETQMKKLGELGRRFDALAATGDKDKLKEAANEFERFFLGQVFKKMHEGIEKSEFSGSSFGQDIFMGMFIDESLKRGSLGSRGIADMIVNQYEKQAKSLKLDSDFNRIQETAKQPHFDLDHEVDALMRENPDKKEVLGIMQELSEMTKHLEHRTSSEYGMRQHPIYKRQRFHHGVDYALGMGEVLTAPSAGTVKFAGKKGGYGQTVILDHGHGVESMYAHLSEIAVKKGDKVNKNSLLGKIGSTGVSTGPHLHFEVRHEDKTMDPKRLMASLKKTSQGL